MLEAAHHFRSLTHVGQDKVPAEGKRVPVAMAVTACGGLEFTVQRVGRFNWTISFVMASSIQLLLKFIKWNQERFYRQ